MRRLVLLFELIWCFIQMYIIGVYILIREMVQGHYSPSDKELPDSTGLIAMVTGGTEGIGLEVVRKLISKNVTVFIASMNKSKAEKIINELKYDYPSSQVYHIAVDLRSLKSVKDCVNEFLEYRRPLHILINNAGVMLTPYTLTTDGFEEQFQVNYLSHFYFTSLLLDKLESSSSPDYTSRIVNVSSAAHVFGGKNLDKLISKCDGLFEYSPHYAYTTSKLAIILATYSLHKELKGSNSHITVNAVHPGIVNTGLYRNVHWSIKWLMIFLAKHLFKTPKNASDSVVFVAIAPHLDGVSGGYYDNCKSVQSCALSYDQSLQKELQCRTKDLLQQKT
ncbi:dehydrogenase/reductase SDR family member on chromosome X isoform X1 [Patella vulgata]|uniref:dehydrogenase/reductase SDR family member on chromosome X isoform X1 n=1 Tax=Patella vulgata TaxID=6465 RepID=UPI00217F5E64|nr:dehydrogenase/reductase SDR family member on chromosome X isoform X1 [Patella vulgata]